MGQDDAQAGLSWSCWQEEHIHMASPYGGASVVKWLGSGWECSKREHQEGFWESQVQLHSFWWPRLRHHRMLLLWSKQWQAGPYLGSGVTDLTPGRSNIKVCDFFCLNSSKDTLHLPITPFISLQQWIPEKCKRKNKLLWKYKINYVSSKAPYSQSGCCISVLSDVAIIN